MEKLFKTTYGLMQYLLLGLLTLGYWVEMAEELEAGNQSARLGKSLLVLLKLLVYPK
ncbi:hypothetical protein [Taibaiella koreensis]|uniref:hypothetical protein n=1 Tax=Taibaiella koreensis TaxID=1268548 RepID=UPI0013C32176|nr:hypothetical protein [Taibaiella koreensis]